MKFKTFVALGILACGAAYYVYKNNDKKLDEDNEKSIIDLNNDQDDKVVLEINDNNDVLTLIKTLYPHLDDEFINVIYGQKEVIANDFPSGKRANIYHEIHFDHLDELYAFVDFVINNDYVVSCDETVGCCKIAKEELLNDNTVIDDIFKVANQASLNNGEYIGYSVDIID